MHWGLDFNLLQDNIGCKYTKATRNLDILQRIVYSLFYIWKGPRKKRADKAKGMAELMRNVSSSITKLLRFYSNMKPNVLSYIFNASGAKPRAATAMD